MVQKDLEPAIQFLPFDENVCLLSVPHNAAMEEMDLPAFVVAERDAVLAEIEATFCGISRHDGISWSEADVIDEGGSVEERALARAKDLDTRWQDLFDDPNWDPENGWHWPYLDAIGFRYYLPAAMVLALRKGSDAGILIHLSLPDRDLQDYKQSKWTSFNLPQQLCIKRFLQYMVVVEACLCYECEKSNWTSALSSYWGRITDRAEYEDSSSKVTARKRRQLAQGTSGIKGRG